MQNALDNLAGVKTVYFIGIGGIAMSAAAGIAKARGFGVFGSDSRELYAPAKDVLDKFKIPYAAGYSGQNLSAGADLYVLSAGEDESNPEVAAVLKQGLPWCSLSELLYLLAQNELRVVVTGTHGKSTTSAMLGRVLQRFDGSSFVVGGVLKNYQSNFYAGRGRYFVFEGDEYKASFRDPTPKFHYYKPDILVLTNLEFDHPDIFENLEQIESEVEVLINNLPGDGLLVYNADDPVATRLAYKTHVGAVSFGIHNPADFRIENLNLVPKATNFSVRKAAPAGEFPENYEIQLPGEINAYNALGAIAAARTLGIAYETVDSALKSYSGLKRRFELIAQIKGITIIDDYGHHPTEVKKTLEAARGRYSKARIWAVFEPHTFSRTRATLPQLAGAFDCADEILISEIYPARENAKHATITSQEVVDAIKNHNSRFQIHNSIRLVQNKDQALKLLKSEAKAGDVVVVMAVGDFNRLAYELLNSFK